MPDGGTEGVWDVEQSNSYLATSGGATLQLTSSDPAGAMPSTVTVPSDKWKSDWFSLTVYPVATRRTVAVQVVNPNRPDQTARLTFALSPAALISVALPSGVTGGQTTTGRVWLDGTAATDVTVYLSTSSGKVGVQTR